MKKADQSSVLQRCNPNIPSTGKDHFVLTLSLNRCFKKVNQTIFIESANDAHEGNFFAISAKVKPGKFKNGTYKKVIFKNFQIKKLTGSEIKIVDASLDVNLPTEEKHIINITVKEASSSGGLKKSVRIPKLESSDMVEIRVAYEETHGTGPRICENYIGSLAN